MGFEGPVPPKAEKPVEPAPQPEVAAPVAEDQLDPRGPGGEYNGYSEAGMAEDKKNEAELGQLLDSYAQDLSGIERGYFASNSPEKMKRGAQIVEEIRQSLDRKLGGTPMKGAKEYGTLYHDKFYAKYSELLLRGTA